MKIEIGKYYNLKMNIFGRDVDYTGKVLNLKNGEFRLETDEDNGCRALTLNEKDIIFSKETSEPEKEEKTWKIRKKRAQDYELKPSVEPDF
ncbi:hypothetical protein GW931_00220 [archaeon]|nr:hypothetical protein [archaeon]